MWPNMCTPKAFYTVSQHCVVSDLPIPDKVVEVVVGERFTMPCLRNSFSYDIDWFKTPYDKPTEKELIYQSELPFFQNRDYEIERPTTSWRNLVIPAMTEEMAGDYR